MNRLFRKTIIVLLATVWSTAVIQAQSVNMNRYITLTVKQGQQIKLNLAADVAGTPIKINKWRQRADSNGKYGVDRGAELSCGGCRYDDIRRCAAVRLQWQRS